MASS
ncbi:hypothetical protein EC07798_1780, partial [Escherichia coli 07798]|jgi:hypothetical protein